MWWPFRRKTKTPVPEPVVEEPEEEKKPRTVNILSIDGGGIRGIIPATELIALSGMLASMCPGKSVTDVFDLFAGTSTGGLIALALTCPRRYTPDEILSLYRDDSKRIFHSPRNLFDRVFNDKYNAESFEKLLGDLFGDAKMCDASKETMVLSYDLSANVVWPISTSANPAVSVRNAARATSAAPTYFPSVKFDGKTLVDGGVAANNPSLYAVIHARSLRPDADVINVLSLGTSGYRMFFDSASGGIGWLDPTKGAPIRQLFTMGQMEATSDIAAAFPGVNYFRIDGSISDYVRMDDINSHTLDFLCGEGKRIAAENSEKLAEFISSALIQ